MRSKLKLWQLVDHHFDGLFYSGLCNVIMRLRNKAIINMNEHLALLNEIEHFGGTGEYFLGEIGYAKPRKEFIQKRVKQYKNAN